MEKDRSATFFSYCHEDATFARQLAEDLKAAGANVWLDHLDIEPGQDWNKAIQDALTDAPHMLVILSPASVQSPNVQNEIIFAHNKNKNIIPVLYRGREVPMQLLRFHYIDLRTDYDSGLKTLMNTLGVKQPPKGSRPTFIRLQTRAQLPSLEEQLTDANSIDASGMSLFALANKHLHVLLERINHGCKVRLLLLNPDNDNLMQMMAPFISSYTVAAHTKAIRESLTKLQSEPALFNSLRLYNYPMAHAMLIINRDTLDARLRVEMYMRSSMPGGCPSFYILRSNDQYWFSTFAMEFDDHWAKARLCLDATSEDIL